MTRSVSLGGASPGVVASVMVALCTLGLPAHVAAQCGGGGGGGGGSSALDIREKSPTRIASRYDRTEDVTRFTVGPVGAGSDMRLMALFECPGESACRPGVVQLVFSTEDRSPRLDDDDAVTLSADNERYAPPVVGFRSQREFGLTSESVAVNLLLADLLEIARADRVEVQIGPLSTALNRGQRKALTSIAEHIESS